MQDDSNLVVPEQGAIYVYTNNDDAVVISQGDDNDPNGDHFVYIHRHHLPALIEKLQTFLLPTTKGRAKRSSTTRSGD